MAQTVMQSEKGFLQLKSVLILVLAKKDFKQLDIHKHGWLIVLVYVKNSKY